MGLLHRASFWTFERLRSRPTRRVVRQLAFDEGLSRRDFERRAADRLRAFCAKAAIEVPYYRQLFADAGLAADGVHTTHDLLALPFLDKEKIRTAGDGLFHGSGGPYRVTETGGSSGDPLRIHNSPLREAAHLAARIRSRAWFGIPAGEPELVLFGGRFDKNARGVLHAAKDALIGSITYPAFGMTAGHLDEMTTRLGSMRPRHVFGYTSALAAWARHIRQKTGREDGAAAHGVKVIFTTSEMLFPDDRSLLEETFGATVADGYGSKEAGFIAHECPEGRMHARTDTHAIEIVRDDGPVTDGEPGELVVTFMGDWHWPFIRYRTGDSAAWTGEGCACGLPLPVLRMAGGRITDLLVRTDGALVHGLGAIYPIRETPGVARFLIHQKSIHEVEVSLVVEPGYPSDGDTNITRQLAKRLGGPNVTIVHVEEIAALASGKQRVVRSDVAR